MNNKTLWIGLGLVVAVFLAGAYIMSNGQKASAPATPNVTIQPEETASPDEEKEEADEVQEVTIEGSEYKFSVSSLTFKSGVPTRITFKNTGKMEHDFVIDELSINTEILSPGEEAVVEFTPEAGTYTFYCSVGAHRALGMEGELTFE